MRNTPFGSYARPRPEASSLTSFAPCANMAMMSDQKAETLGPEITRLRLKAGLTLRRLAELVDISAAYLSDIEHDRRRPSPEVLERLAKELQGAGTSYEALDQLNSRFERDLQRWVSETPAVRQMLRAVKDSKRNPRELLQELERSVKKDKR